MGAPEVVRIHGVDNVLDRLGHIGRERGRAMAGGTVDARFDLANVETIAKTAGKVITDVLDQKVARLCIQNKRLDRTNE